MSGVDIVTAQRDRDLRHQGPVPHQRHQRPQSERDLAVYDQRFGAALSHTGPNGLTTTWSYDVFGRKTLEVRADGTQTKWDYLFCSGFNGGTASCPAGAVYLIKATPLASDGATQNGPIGTVYFDQLDREIARDTQGFDGSTIRAATAVRRPRPRAEEEPALLRLGRHAAMDDLHLRRARPGGHRDPARQQHGAARLPRPRHQRDQRAQSDPHGHQEQPGPGGLGHRRRSTARRATSTTRSAI